MADLDIQIDVPDDDDLSSPVRVLNGSWVPPWLKAIAVLLLGGFLALVIGAFLLGRAQPADAPAAAPTTARTTSLSSAEDSLAIARSLEAVQDWEAFARSADLGVVADSFDPDGPQYAVFAAAAETPEVAELDFAARNVSETSGEALTTVSIDLVVSGTEGQQIYPYDFVYLDGHDRVWTVVDRRSPGQVALPPARSDIDAASQSWTRFTSSLSIDDDRGVGGAVSGGTLALAEQLLAAAAQGPAAIADPLIDDPDLFELLVDRIRAAGALDAGDAVIALLDQDQRRNLAAGELTSWTRTDPDRIIATLEVSGDPVTTVPFVPSAEGWAFDLVGALNTSGGAP